MLAEKRVVVTGGAGFIGSHLNERRIRHGREAICVDGLVPLTQTPRKVTGPINLDNPIEFATPELAETIFGLPGSPSRIAHEPPPVDNPKRRRPAAGGADEWLGCRPSPPLRDALGPTVAHFDRRLQREPPTA